MKLIITKDGVLGGVYGEAINLSALGAPEIRRASHVEPDQDGQWTANLAPVGGPLLGPFPFRSEALKAERDYLEKHLPAIMHR